MLRGLLLAALLGGSASAEDITSARYEEPTTRYAHGILGDAIEHGALVMVTGGWAAVAHQAARNPRI